MTPFFPFLPSADLRTDFWPVLQQDKIQHLRDSVQSITSELNGVLGVLDSLSHHQTPLLTSTAREGIPLPTYCSRGGLQGGSSLGNPPRVSPLDQWAWSSSRLSSNYSISGQSVDNMLTDKWHRYFPGESPGLNPPACCLQPLILQPCEFCPSFQCWEGWVHRCC